MKKILLTFDYELFLGDKSGTAEKCIINPVEELIHIFKKLGIKATFFVDILYYLKCLEKRETQNQAEKLKQNLIKLVENNHRIELHLHAHWLDAIYEQGEWKFEEYRYFRLHNLPQEKITELFVSGVNALEKIAREVKPDYKVIAFRAGGWCIQPFEKIKKGFIKSGIKIDSSVLPGIKGKSLTHEYDFVTAPKAPIYKFNNNVLIKDDDGEFSEIPVTTYSVNIFKKIINRFKTKLPNYKQSDIYGDGKGRGTVNKSFFQKLKEPRKASLDIKYTPFLNELKSFIKRKQGVINVVSHPKTLTPLSFDAIEFMAENGCEFITFQDL